MRRLVLVAVALAALVACGSDDSENTADAVTTTTAPTTPVTVETIEYGRAEVADGEVALLLDLYRQPRAVERLQPVMIAIHGGGFTMQSRTDDGIVRIAQALAERGVVVASIDYRLDPQGPAPSDRVGGLLDSLTAQGVPIAPAMAAAVDDTLTAIDWLTEHAPELGIDRARLGLLGSSSGAITADTVAYALDDLGDGGRPVAFVASLWGGILVQPEGVTNSGALLGDGEPTLFLVHGDADQELAVGLSDQLADRAEAVGVPVEYLRLAGAGHGYQLSGFFDVDLGDGQTAFDRLIEATVEALA